MNQVDSANEKDSLVACELKELDAEEEKKEGSDTVKAISNTQEDVASTKVLPHSFGKRKNGPSREYNDKRMNEIFPKGTPLPCQKSVFF